MLLASYTLIKLRRRTGFRDNLIIYVFRRETLFKVDYKYYITLSSDY